ncbi:MAG: hypothetical protein RI967_2508, partial [Planctomycetota bacterium]
MRRLAILFAASVALVASLAASASARASAPVAVAVAVAAPTASTETKSPSAVRDQRTPRNAVFLFLSLAREGR